MSKEQRRPILKVGRPRTRSPQPEEAVELGEAMVKWCMENKPYRLAEWYCIEMGITEKDWKCLSQMPEFLAYYDQAKAIVAQQHIDGSVNPSIAHRFLGIYCKDVRQREKDLKDEDLANAIAKIEAEAKIKAKDGDKHPSADAITSMMSGLSPDTLALLNKLSPDMIKQLASLSPEKLAEIAASDATKS
jgi:hypothetical protein